MHSTLTLSALVLALTSNVLSAPLQPRQNSQLTLADTVNFIAKTIGSNPNPAALPDINNYLFIPVHTGAGQNTATLIDPSTSSFNSSLPSYFRNGTDVPHGDGGYVTAGYIYGTTPYSLSLSLSHETNSSNPGAYTGFVEFNVGIGTNGMDISDEGKLITSRYVSDEFWACPNVPVEGGTAVVVEVSNRYADAPEGCWGIELVAECAGSIEEVNREAFPSFVQSSCFINASAVEVGE